MQSSTTEIENEITLTIPLKTVKLIEALAQSRYGEVIKETDETSIYKMLTQLIHDTASAEGIEVDCLRTRATESVKNMAQVAFEKSYDENPGYWRLAVDGTGLVSWKLASSKGEYGEGECVLMSGVGCNGYSNGAGKNDYLNDDGSFVAFSDIFPNQNEAEYMQDALDKLQKLPEGWFDDESALILA